MEKIIGTVPGKCRKKREKARLTLNNNPEISWHMKKSRRTYNGVHLNKKSNTQDVVEQSLTNNPDAMEFLLSNKLAEDTGYRRQSGWVSYPMVTLNLPTFYRLDPHAFSAILNIR